jgi:hypothetical protein
MLPTEILPRTYRLRNRTVVRLDRIARELDLWPSTLVDGLLDHMLDEVDAGRLVIERRPVKWELSSISTKH